MSENDEKKQPKTRNAKARESIHKALSENPDGMTKADLVRRVRNDWPGEFEGHDGRQAVGAALHNDKQVRRDAIKQLWQLLDVSQSTMSPKTEEEGRNLERAWYEPVAKRLVDDGLCTSAQSIGQALNGPKWTNPDVIGFIKPTPVAAVHNFPTELVAVEIKRAFDPVPLLTGFAQACAYLDFAHVSWLMIPRIEYHDATFSRVERLCAIHGLGLAYVHEEEDEEGEKDIWLEIAVKPRRHQPGVQEFANFLTQLADKQIKFHE